jgi:hypothetical protein
VNNNKNVANFSPFSTSLIRFATNIILIDVKKKRIKSITRFINKFLKKRNLTLKKTKRIKWSLGNKLNFLGWTFHWIIPNKKNWITNFTKKISINSKRKLYVYPNKKNTQNVKLKIKNLLSLKNTSLTPQQIIKKLNSIILKWNNYFSLNLNQNLLGTNLD